MTGLEKIKIENPSLVEKVDGGFVHGFNYVPATSFLSYQGRQEEPETT
ncbi:MAG: hypothetical protein ACI9DF_004100 [Verrucomicrobiales bacterium]|jgi:hypothetical protein